MSEKAYSVQRSVRVGKFTFEERLCLKLVAVAITVALALAVIMLRFQRLDELPPGLYVDEGRDGVGALRVLRGEHAIFFPDIGHGPRTFGFVCAGSDDVIVWAYAACYAFAYSSW